MKKVLYLFIALSLLSSCSKTTDEIKIEAKLIGQWTLVKSGSKDFISGVLNRNSSHNFYPGDFIEFQSGGKCTAKVDGYISQTTWQLLNDNKTIWLAENGVLDLSESGYEIVTLTDNTFVITARETSGTSTNEATIYMDK